MGSEEARVDLRLGDEVRVAPDAGAEYRPGSRAWVVALASAGVVTRDGSVTVEFEDGSDMDVPVVLLVLVSRGA